MFMNVALNHCQEKVVHNSLLAPDKSGAGITACSTK